jgi:pleiotropic regulator 1
MSNFVGHNKIINSMCINNDNVMVSAADDGTMSFWDWKTGYRFQKLTTITQSGSLDCEKGIFCARFDQSGSRLITTEADKTIKMYKEDENSTPENYEYEIPNIENKRY